MRASCGSRACRCVRLSLVGSRRRASGVMQLILSEQNKRDTRLGDPLCLFIVY